MGWHISLSFFVLQRSRFVLRHLTKQTNFFFFFFFFSSSSSSSSFFFFFFFFFCVPELSSRHLGWDTDADLGINRKCRRPANRHRLFPQKIQIYILCWPVEQRVLCWALTSKAVDLTVMWYCVDWWSDRHVVLCWLVIWPSCGTVLTGDLTVMCYCVDWWSDRHVVLCWAVIWPSCGTVLSGGIHKLSI